MGKPHTGCHVTRAQAGLKCRHQAIETAGLDKNDATQRNAAQQRYEKINSVFHKKIVNNSAESATCAILADKARYSFNSIPAPTDQITLA